MKIRINIRYEFIEHKKKNLKWHHNLEERISNKQIMFTLIPFRTETRRRDLRNSHGFLYTAFYYYFHLRTGVSILSIPLWSKKKKNCLFPSSGGLIPSRDIFCFSSVRCSNMHCSYTFTVWADNTYYIIDNKQIIFSSWI